MKGRDRPFPADTIAAISTAPGRAGISVVRVSGPGALAVAEKLGIPELAPLRATLAPVYHPEDGRMVDRAVLTLHRAPSSYTGEDLLEISGHGGFLVPQLILDAACAAGARLARPGEFTMRAFLNGRMDLVQAEATLDLIDARSEAAHKSALFQLERGLSRRIEELRDEVIGLLALLAYEIDFPEEDDGPVPESRIAEAADSLVNGLRKLLLHAPEGEMVRDGALTVIAGLPNAGKSSLFNALLGEERAIVTETPGTTRDAIEAILSVEGYPFRLVDTAGLRSRPGRVEGLGIEVAESYLQKADIVLFCAEAGRPLGAEERQFLEKWSGEGRAGQPEGSRPVVITVRTKADPSLAIPSAAAGEVEISAVEGRGLEPLRSRILDAAYAGLRGSGEMPLVTRRRQSRALGQALEDVEAFVTTRDRGHPPEIAETHLQDARHALEELLGVVDTEDFLDVLFSGFCVGK